VLNNFQKGNLKNKEIKKVLTKNLRIQTHDPFNLIKIDYPYH